MIKGAGKYFSKNILFYLFATFFLASTFFAKSVNAVVYLGQTYTGMGIGGYYYGDIQNLYYSYPGWIDFILFLMIFTSLGKFVFGKKFKDNSSAANGLSLSLGVALSLGMVLWESSTGVFLLKNMAVLALGLGIVAIFVLLYLVFRKWMRIGQLLSLILALVASYFLWHFVARYVVGMGPVDFVRYVMGGFNFDANEIINWAVMIIFFGGLLALMGMGIKNAGKAIPAKNNKNSSLFGEGQKNSVVDNTGTATPVKGSSKWRWPFRKKQKPAVDKKSTTPPVKDNDDTDVAPLPEPLPIADSEVILDPKQKKITCDRIKHLVRVADYAKEAVNESVVIVDKLRGEINMLNHAISVDPSLTDKARILQDKFMEINNTLNSLRVGLINQATPIKVFSGMELWINHIKTYFDKNIYSVISNVQSLNAYVGEIENTLKLLDIAFGKTSEKSGKMKRLGQSIRIIISASEPYKKMFRPSVVDMNLNQYKNFLVGLWNTYGCGDTPKPPQLALAPPRDTPKPPQLALAAPPAQLALAAPPATPLLENKAEDGAGMNQPPKNELPEMGDREEINKDIDRIEEIIGKGIRSLPREKGSLFGRGSNRDTTIANFAYKLVFSRETNLSREIGEFLLIEINKIKGIIGVFMNSESVDKNSKEFNKMMQVYEDIIRAEPLLKKLSKGIRSREILNSMRVAYQQDFAYDNKVAQVYKTRFNEPLARASWDEALSKIFSDPVKLEFLLINNQGNKGLTILYTYFSRAYGSLRILDRNFRRMAKAITALKRQIR
ncbi:MAG: hypothetical protein Q8Q42_04550 [Nanoarchaeota archaeon]|nr:hypothetical protein [Nanoarchaeota archaeon]